MAFRPARTLVSSVRGIRSAPSFREARPASYRSLLAGITLGSLVVWYSASEDVSTIATIKQRWILHSESPSIPDHNTISSRKDAFRVDSETSIPFPTTLPTLSSSSPLTLIGLGVRKVSFLRVKVYSVGFYMDPIVLDNLDTVKGWAGFTAQRLIDQPSSTDATSSGETLMNNLLELPVTCAVRIVPSRNTDFNHLRDGFTRALVARQKLAKSNLTDQDDERISKSLQTFKSIFPTGMTVPKGNSLVLIRTSSKDLVVEYDGKILGKVEDEWLSREMILAYFANKDVISPRLKEDVARGFESLIK